MRTIYIDAGHGGKDKGANVGIYWEGELVQAIRNQLKVLIRAEFIPDDLNLKQTIEYINKTAKSEDLAISIHLNSHKNPSVRGTEAFYSDNPRLAEIFSRFVAKELLIPNRGPIHDSQTFVGSLGFLRQLKCQSVLIEVCYLTNEEDRKRLLNGGIFSAALGIKRAIESLNTPVVDKLSAIQAKINEIREAISRLFKKS